MNETPIPRFVKAIIGIAVAGLALVAFTAWQVASIRAEEEQRDCDRAVAARDDTRAVWAYLMASGDLERADGLDVAAFMEFLDERLPALVCEGGNPIPQPPEE
jgi:hypothetical protein